MIEAWSGRTALPSPLPGRAGLSPYEEEGTPMTPATRIRMLLLAACAVAWLPPSARAEDVDWRSDYSAARKEASEKGRPILVDFGFEGCAFCRKLDATTFRDADVVKRMNEQFIPIRIDIEKDPRKLHEQLGL